MIASIPPISGNEAEILAIANESNILYSNLDELDLDAFQSSFACALHMHQPTIPAGKDGELISNLQYMFEHRDEGDNHNAEAFAYCYKRMGEIIPNLIKEGCNPKIMLDYSGNLLWGFEQMGRNDILDSLRSITCDSSLHHHVEWLGTFWSHAVASSTPIDDLKLQIEAWQSHFSSIFGISALRRVKGFSLPEMHLPNNPDYLFELVKSLKNAGYLWLLVQEHTVENLDGSELELSQKYIPNQLTCRNSKGEIIEIIALIKTQGSDTKLVGQMQPYYEALGVKSFSILDTRIPSLVFQIADGENGGVMMNEFPSAFTKVFRSLKTQSDDDKKVVPFNGTEYLESLQAKGIGSSHYPRIQASQQHKLWQFIGNTISPEITQKAIAQLKEIDPSFTLSGSSWTNNISWENGYENILEPINRLSSSFHETFDNLVAKDPLITKTLWYKKSLLYLLILETSCFRYWGQGTWTNYARDIYSLGKQSLLQF